MQKYRLMGVRPSLPPAFLICLTPFLLDDGKQLFLHCPLNLHAVYERQHAGDRLQHKYDDHQTEILQMQDKY